MLLIALLRNFPVAFLSEIHAQGWYKKKTLDNLSFLGRFITGLTHRS